VSVPVSKNHLNFALKNKHLSTCQVETVQGAASRSNPLPCFVNISTMNRNFYKKIYTTIDHSYLHLVAELLNYHNF